MHVDITGRNIDVTPALREFTAEKLHKLDKLLDGPLEVHVVLGIEKHRHYAEIQVKSKTAVFSGHHETGDLYASIGEVADKLERQALKHKEKLHHHKRPTPRDPDIAAAIEANAAPEAPPSEAGGEQGAPRRVLRTQSYRVRPMSVEDAVMELEASGQLLLVFRHAASERVRVVYRQADGNFGLVEPEL